MLILLYDYDCNCLSIYSKISQFYESIILFDFDYNDYSNTTLIEFL